MREVLQRLQVESGPGVPNQKYVSGGSNFPDEVASYGIETVN